MLLKKTQESFSYLNVVLQLSQLPTKQATDNQQKPAKDSNIINYAADDLVGLLHILFFYLLLLFYIIKMYINVF